jgi:hypothetical protein
MESDPDPAEKCSTCRMQCTPYKTGWQKVCRHIHKQTQHTLISTDTMFTYAHIHVSTCVCVCVCVTHTCVCVCAYACVRVCLYNIHTRTHAYAHTYVHTHTHTHMTGAASSRDAGGTVDMQEVREVMRRTMWRILAQGLCNKRCDRLPRLCRWLLQVCC